MKVHELITLLNTLNPELTVQCLERCGDYTMWKDLSSDDVTVRENYVEIGDN